MKVIEVIEQSGWLTAAVVDDNLECEGYTPAGEDFVFYLSGKNDEEWKESLQQHAQGFDVDEHVELFINCRGKNGVPSSITALLEDAKWIKNELQKIAKMVEEE